MAAYTTVSCITSVPRSGGGASITGWMAEGHSYTTRPFRITSSYTMVPKALSAAFDHIYSIGAAAVFFVRLSDSWTLTQNNAATVSTTLTSPWNITRDNHAAWKDYYYECPHPGDYVINLGRNVISAQTSAVLQITVEHSDSNSSLKARYLINSAQVSVDDSRVGTVIIQDCMLHDRLCFRYNFSKDGVLGQPLPQDVHIYNYIQIMRGWSMWHIDGSDPLAP